MPDPWYVADKGQAWQGVVANVRQIRDAQAAERFADLLHASLYGNIPLSGLGYGSAPRAITNPSRLSLNVIRNMANAVTSKVAAKNKPKVTFLTEEGDYEKRVEAERLEAFVGGVFYEEGVYGLLTKAFRHATVLGTGILKIHDEEEKVCVEPVLKTELFVDEVEGAAGSPPNLYQTKYVDRRVSKKRWAADDAELALKIDRCPREADDVAYSVTSTADQILVFEAWHLPVGDAPGRHVVCIDGADLVDEEWDEPTFPFSFLRWSPALTGFWGTGLAEELRGIQEEINKLLIEIQKAHHLVKGHYLVEAGSKLAKGQLNNDLASIVTFTGSKPTYEAPVAIAPDVYAHLDRLYAKAFEISGISQLNATGQKPAGLDSGAAQRAYQDIQTERFLEVGQEYEEFVVEVARQVVRCAKRIGGEYKVRAVDGRRMTKIKWSEIDLDDTDYVMKAFPGSLLPTNPAGRIAWAQEMAQGGLIPAEDVLDVVDFPDTEAYAKRKNAARRLVERNIDKMLREGEFVSPEPFDNHPLALKLVNEAYHSARIDNVPEEKLELLRQYMTATQDFMAPPPPPSLPPPVDPMAAPMAGPPMPPGPPGPMPPPDMAPPGIAA